LLLRVVLLVCLLARCSLLQAQEESRQGKVALPGEPCQTAPHATWTPQEQWVWGQICIGKVANFNSIREYGGELDPTHPDVWQQWEGRVLQPVFLETILLYKPWRDAMPRQGVRIVGAWFKEPLDLSNAELTRELSLHDSRFESTVSLSRLHTTELLSLEGSTIDGILDMKSRC
jgi:hypothetical protein